MTHTTAALVGATGGAGTTRTVLESAVVLAADGAGAEDVLKTTVFLADIDDFDEMNDTYATFFDDEPPARSAVEVGALPKGVAVEIEAVAVTTDA